MSISAALLAVTVQAAGVMPVRGPSACPTPAEVGAALVGLVAPVAPPAAPDAVEIVGAGEAGTGKLRSAPGDPSAARGLPPPSSCAERARAAAVIVAAWEAHLRAGATPMWPLAATPPPAPPPAPRPAAPPVAAQAAPPPPVPLHVET